MFLNPRRTHQFQAIILKKSKRDFLYELFGISIETKIEKYGSLLSLFYTFLVINLLK